MPRGGKEKYSSKQKRQAQHIEESEKKKGRSSKDAARIAWATVNKETGGAGKSVKNTASSKKGGHRGGKKSPQSSRRSSSNGQRTSALDRSLTLQFRQGANLPHVSRHRFLGRLTRPIQPNALKARLRGRDGVDIKQVADVNRFPRMHSDSLAGNFKDSGIRLCGAGLFGSDHGLKVMVDFAAPELVVLLLNMAVGDDAKMKSLQRI